MHRGGGRSWGPQAGKGAPPRAAYLRAELRRNFYFYFYLPLPPPPSPGVRAAPESQAGTGRALTSGLGPSTSLTGGRVLADWAGVSQGGGQSLGLRPGSCGWGELAASCSLSVGGAGTVGQPATATREAAASPYTSPPHAVSTCTHGAHLPPPPHTQHQLARTHTAALPPPATHTHTQIISYHLPGPDGINFPTSPTSVAPDRPRCPARRCLHTRHLWKGL